MLGAHARTYLLGVNPQMYDHRIWHEECSNIGVSFDTTEFQYIEPFRRDPTVWKTEKRAGGSAMAIAASVDAR